MTTLAIPALLGAHVIGPYEGQPKPPLEVVVVTKNEEQVYEQYKQSHQNEFRKMKMSQIVWSQQDDLNHLPETLDCLLEENGVGF